MALQAAATSCILTEGGAEARWLCTSTTANYNNLYGHLSPQG